MSGGFILHCLDAVSSTGDVVRDMAEAGAPEWTAVTARSQSAGRGRRGRSWHSPEGGLYLSVLVRPRVPPSLLPRLPLLAGLALCRALERSGLRFRLKWPNDLLLSGRKAAGVLAEARTTGGEVSYAVLGFGVNLSAPDLLYERLAGRFAALDEAGVGWTRERIIEDLARELRALVPSALSGVDWDRALDAWRERAEWGLPCEAVSEGRPVRGRCVGIDRDGALILETERGRVTVRSGDVVEVAENPSSES